MYVTHVSVVVRRYEAKMSHLRSCKLAPPPHTHCGPILWCYIHSMVWVCQCFLFLSTATSIPWDDIDTNVPGKQGLFWNLPLCLSTDWIRSSIPFPPFLQICNLTHRPELPSPPISAWTMNILVQVVVKKPSRALRVRFVSSFLPFSDKSWRC